MRGFISGLSIDGKNISWNMGSLDGDGKVCIWRGSMEGRDVGASERKS